MSKPGRNDPCPCGSRKKYKHCHWLAEQGTISESERARQLHDLDGEMVRRLARFAEREFGQGWVGDLLGQLEIDDAFDSEPGLSQLIGPCALYEWRSDEGTIAEMWLASSPAGLSDRQRGWLEAQGRAWLSIWEVRAVTPDLAVSVRDFFTGEERHVLEKSGSRTLTPRDAILGRVVNFEGISVFCGMYPRILPPRPAAGVVAAIRKILGVRTSKVSVGRLRDAVPPSAWVATWGEAVRLQEVAASRIPQLSNTDGDPLLLTKDRFDFVPADRACIAAKLMDLAQDDDPEDDGAERSFTFKKPGNAMHKSWDNTIVGHAVLESGALVLETNSIRRADDLRAKVERALDGLARYRVREYQDPEVALREAGAPSRRSGSPARKDDPTPPELVEALKDLKRRHMEEWLDTPIPALSGMTPREAAAKPRKRKELLLLLKEIENHESRAPKEQQVDVSFMWSELGLGGAR